MLDSYQSLLVPGAGSFFNALFLSGPDYVHTYIWLLISIVHAGIYVPVSTGC